MSKTSKQQIENYKQGAAESRALQVQAAAGGDTELARLAAQSVDANLDRINELTKES